MKFEEKLNQTVGESSLEHESTAEKLDQALAEIARSINEETGLKLVGPTGKIKMNDPNLSLEERRKNAELVSKRELAFSKADNPDFRAGYAAREGKEGLSEEELIKDIVKHWQETRESDKSGQFEKYITILLHKAFGDEYYVMRSSNYDDYEHGIDNVIVNKKTGEILCAIDEVHDRSAGESLAAKKDKFIELNKKGGAKVTYGLLVEDGKARPGKRKDIPVFYLTMSLEEFEHALNDAHIGDLKAFTPEEEGTCHNLLDSLDEQINELENVRLPLRLAANLVAFKKNLSYLKNKVAA